MSYLNTRKALLLSLACSSIALTACQVSPASQHSIVKLNPPKAHSTVVDTTVDTTVSTKAHSSTPAKGHKVHWGYGEEGTVAPAQWGNLKGNATCKTGEKQSPINIETVLKATTPLNFTQKHHPQDFNVSNNGHTVVFHAQSPSHSEIKVNDKAYELLQFHYHAPSEHQVMGKNYPLEIHFVHKSKDGQLAVIGVLYNIGQDNAQLAGVVDKLGQNIEDSENDVVLSGFNIDSIMPTDKQTLAYSGSLTTPPCSEQVQWLVQKTPVNIGQGQLEKFTDLYKANNRPVQPKNGRTVDLH